MRTFQVKQKLHESLDLERLREIYRFFPREDFPFLTQLTEKMRDEKPYKGLRILHNTHLIRTAVCKLEPLLVSGAEVTVTVTPTLNRDPEVIRVLKKANVRFVEARSLRKETTYYDFCLDCCAGLLKLVKPRYGAIELTQTGSVKYKEAKTPYPVISVDDSMLKNLENLLGTGEGFVRAFLQLTRENIHNKKFILFGYGRVGQGVVRALSSYTNQVVIVENNRKVLEYARSKGVLALHISDSAVIHSHLQDAFCVVTATGVEGVISQYFEREHFKNVYLANIGSEDEFGHKFSPEDILYNKTPLNFSLQEPTRIKYLDPVFYAHNTALDFILSGQITKGFHPYPSEYDRKILEQWVNYHPNDAIQELYQV